MATINDHPRGGFDTLPAFVLAHLLRDAPLGTLLHVAHASRALHTRMMSDDQCQCARVVEGTSLTQEAAYANTFWSHWRDHFRTRERKAHRSVLHHASVPRARFARYARSVHSPTFVKGVLQWACRCGQLRVVELFLSEPCVDATTCESVALPDACEYGHLDVVERLLRVPGIDVRTGQNYALRCAVRNGHAHVARRLFRVSGVLEDYDDVRRALGEAEAYGRFDMAGVIMAQWTNMQCR